MTANSPDGHNSKNSHLSASQYVDRVEALFERGNYRETLELLSQALAAHPESIALRLWQAIVTDAAGDTDTAIELVRPLTRGGDRETRQQASYLLKIWQAPRLERPQAWMTDVPSVSTTGDRATVVRSQASARTPSGAKGHASRSSAELTDEPTRESSDTALPGWWVAIAAIAVILLAMMTVRHLP